MHEIIKPFGPRLFYTKVPDIIINQLNDGFDSMIERQDHSDRLVGHVAEEITLDIEQFPMFGAYMSNQLNTFYSEHNKEYDKINGSETPDEEYIMCVSSSWFVRSFEGDYNPSHFHNGCDYSCILYTKLPPTISDKNTRNTNKKATEGYIDEKDLNYTPQDMIDKVVQFHREQKFSFPSDYKPEIEFKVGDEVFYETKRG